MLHAVLLVLCSLAWEPSAARDPAARQESRAAAVELPAPLADLLAVVRRAREARDLAGARAGLRTILDEGPYADLLGQAEAVVELGLRVLEQEADFAGEQTVLLVVREERVERWSATMDRDHPRLLAAKEALGVSRYATGDVAGAGQLFEEVLEARSRLLASDDLALLRARQNVAASRKHFGDLAGARELEEGVLEARRLQLPPDHPDVLLAQQNLGATLYALGDFAGARPLYESVLEARTRLLPADHPDVLLAQQNLGTTLHALGDLAGAQRLYEAVLEARARLLPADHPLLLSVRSHLGSSHFALREFSAARDLWESVLEAQQRILSPEDLNLLSTKANVALARKELGDIAGVRELEEDVLATLTRLVPPEHPQLLRAKVNLAVTRGMLGDLEGARELEESVLAIWRRVLPPDHPDLLHLMVNLAATRALLGDHAGERELVEVVLEARTRLLPADHPKLLEAQLALAAALRGLDELPRACELEQAVVDAYSRSRRADDRELLEAQANLLITRRALGDLDGAREFGEALLATAAGLPPDDAILLTLLHALADTRIELGDVDGARELLLRLLAGLRRLAEPLRSEAPRTAREGARAALSRLFEALVLVRGERVGGLDAELLATLEELRFASVASVETAHALAERPELAQEARRVAALRSGLNDLVVAGPADGGDVERWRGEIVRRTEERDRAERGLRAKLAQGGAFSGRIEPASVGARLAEDAVAVSFLRVPWTFWDGQATGVLRDGSVLAFVVCPDGGVRRVELGPASELEALVHGWRSALGRPLEARGLGVAESSASPADLEGLGRRLRERVLDPVLAAAGGARRLHVVLDDALHLVPLDALPIGEELVGERLVIHHEVTLARLLRAEAAPVGEGDLLLAGGLDYDAELGAAPAALLDSSPPPLAPASERAGSLGAFAPLAGTLPEVEAIAELYATSFEREPVLLRGAGVTKAALLAAVPRARFLHLATHGWFASETFQSQLDSRAFSSGRSAYERAEATLVGFAPETLCGLALAGANRGRDALGRVPGILTAEELATFDLRDCELAVLSACETNVGIRRAGQGIQSLQAALHAAGARTAITSLWKVDDAATRRLFERFYTKLWQEGVGKSDALWRAKMALRAEGHPPRDWAGWVLSGDPD